MCSAIKTWNLIRNNWFFRELNLIKSARYENYTRNKIGRNKKMAGERRYNQNPVVQPLLTGKSNSFYCIARKLWVFALQKKVDFNWDISFV